MNQFLLSKARTGRSDRYLRQLRVSLTSFASGRALEPVGAVTTADVEDWFRAHDWSPKTVQGYLGDVRTLFAWCVRRGWCCRNPADGIDRPRVSAGRVSIMAPAEIGEVLRRVFAQDKAVGRVLALRFFAGVRSAESVRMTEAAILPGHVVVGAHEAKTRSRRLVEIRPALAAFLALGGSLPVPEIRVRRVLAASKVVIPPNAARHSFVSYHLAAFESPGKTATEAGHAEAILFRNYRELVTAAQAAEFWALRPTA